MARSTRKPSPKRETETLKKVQRIAKQPQTPGTQTLPTDGITSSAQALDEQIQKLTNATRSIAIEHHIDVADITREIERRIRA